MRFKLSPDVLAAAKAEAANVDLPADYERATDESGPKPKVPSKAKLRRQQSRKRPTEIALAKVIQNAMLKEGPCVYASGKVWRYIKDTGLWNTVDINDVQRMVQALDGTVQADGTVRLNNNNVIGITNCILRDLEDKDFFNDAERGILCLNGFLDLGGESPKLVPFSPAHKARWQLQVEYEPHCWTAKWEWFLRQKLFKGDEDREEKIQVLQEFTGAALAQLGPAYGKVLILLGHGANGKSTIADLLSCLFQGVTSVGPHQWHKETYLAKLITSPLNVCNELPDSKILAGELFKAVTTGEPVTARQLYRDPVEFCPICSHIFACNELPGTGDQTKGFWRRLIVLTFNNDFSHEGKTKKQVLDELKPHMAAVLRWAVDGIPKLRERGEYAVPPSSLRALQGWKLESDSVAGWLEEVGYKAWECNSSGEKPKLLKALTLYTEYKKYTTRCGRSPVSNVKFGKRLASLGFTKTRLGEGWFYKVQKEEEVE